MSESFATPWSLSLIHISALFAPDEKTAAFCGVDLADCDWLRFDGDARYERVLTYDAGTFRPYLSCPYGVDNVHPVSYTHLWVT